MRVIKKHGHFMGRWKLVSSSAAECVLTAISGPVAEKGKEKILSAGRSCILDYLG